MIPTFTSSELKSKLLDRKSFRTESLVYIDPILANALKERIIPTIRVSKTRLEEYWKEYPIIIEKVSSLRYSDYVNTILELVASDVKEEVLEGDNEQNTGKDEKNVDPINKDQILNKQLEDVKREYESIITEVDLDRRNIKSDKRHISEILELNKTLAIHPLFRRSAKSSVVDSIIADQIKDEARIKKIKAIDVNWSTDPISDLDKAVKKKIISESEKDSLLNGYHISLITDRNLELSRSLIASSKVSNVIDLIQWEQEDWREILTSDASKEEIDDDQYIKNMMKAVERSFPTAYYLHRVKQINKKEVSSQIDDLEEVNIENSSLLKDKIVDWTKVSKRQKKAKEKTISSLRKTSNRFKQLGVINILSDSGAKSTKTRKINARINALHRFIDDNTDIDIMSVNLISKPNGGSDLNWSSVPEDMQDAVQKQMLSFQRARTVAPDTESSIALLENNYDSALRIANANFTEFQSAIGLEPNTSISIYNNAVRRASISSQYVQAFSELQHNVSLGLRVDNTIPHAPQGFAFPSERVNDAVEVPTSLYDQFRNELQDIAGFEDIFGPQNFCQCDHCKSIFSPAAYFVDMMNFVDKHITSYSLNTFGSSDPNNPNDNDNENYQLYLPNRRPDLWDLKITCENTYEMLPYLQIVNEVKEAYINNVWAAQATPPAYNGSTFEDLHTSANQTFLASLTPKSYQEMLILLEYFDFDIKDITYLLLQDPEQKSLSFLHIYKDSLDYTGSINKLFGDNTAFSSMSVVDFLKFTHISRAELTLILNSNFVGSQSNIEIVKEEFDEGIQYWGEELTLIDEKSLRYFVYFLTIYRSLPFSVNELDLIYDSISIIVPNSSTVPYSGDQLNLLVHLLQLKERLKVSVEELIAIAHIIPDISISSKKQKDPLTQEIFEVKSPSYFSRTFNLEKIFNGQSGNTTIARDTEEYNFLLAGFRVTKEEFEALWEWQYPNTTNIVLNPSSRIKLSNVNKHFQLARRLGMTILEWITYHDHAITLSSSASNTVEELNEILDNLSILKSSEFSINEVISLSNNSQNLDVDIEVLKSVLYDSESIQFDINILKPALSDANLAALVSLLSQSELIVFHEEPNTYSLAVKYNLNTLAAAIQSDTNLTPLTDDINELLNAFSPSIFIKQSYVSVSELAALSESVTIELVSQLIQILSNGNHIKYVEGASYFRVQNSYDFSHLQNAIDNIEILDDQSARLPQETALAKAQLLTIVQIIDAILIAKHPSLIKSQFLINLSNYSQETLDSINLAVNLDFSVNLFENINSLDYSLLNNNNTDPSISEGQLVLLYKQYAWLHLLLDKFEFSTSSLNFIFNDGQSNIFEISDIEQLTNGFTLKQIEYLRKYRLWCDLDNETVTTILHPFLLGIKLQSNIADIEIALLHYYQIPVTISSSIVLSSFDLPNTNALHLADTLVDVTRICNRVNVTFPQLNSFTSTSYADLEAAASILTSGIRRDFEFEEKYNEIIDPYKSKINELNRDYLCAYIMSLPELNFKDTNELYAYFLLDPEMSGCMKISRMVSAHLTIQLYIHRVLLNLEQNEILENGLPTTTFRARLDPDVVEEWEWRKNYQVYVVNKKVAVYPENYMEPEWRDNKSPEFKQLEDELLQKKITTESAEAAYKEYLMKFDLLSNLTIVGSLFHDKGSNGEYYIFIARTSSDPYQYYHRKFYPKRRYWTNWDKIDVAIASPFASPVIRYNKLYVFWLNVQVLEKSKIDGGNSKPDGFDVIYDLKYSRLQENGKWMPPQSLKGFMEGRTGDKIWSKLISAKGFLNNKIFNKVYPYVKEINLNTDLVQNIIIDYHFKESTQSTGYISYKLDLYTNSCLLYGLSDYWLGVLDDLHLAWASRGGDTKVLSVSSASYTTPIGALEYEINKEQFLTNNLSNLTSPFPTDRTDNEIRIVSNRTNESIFRYNDQQFLIKNSEPSDYELSEYATFQAGTLQVTLYPSNYSDRKLVRLNTTLSEYFGRKLASEGLDGILSIGNQYHPENELDINFINQWSLSQFEDPIDRPDFKSSSGTYFREILFHAPYMVANNLNADGKYKEADWWYRKIFDPSAEMDDRVVNPIDRNWQYVEFRDRAFPLLSQDLSDPSFLEVYKKDPFSPFAIGRIRPSAFQKATVIKYIDNLLDWADSLFRKFQFETINEAMMLYVLAQDILGERPKELCKCVTASDQDLSYGDISSSLSDGSDFLIWVENFQSVIAAEETSRPISGSRMRRMPTEQLTGFVREDIYQEVQEVSLQELEVGIADRFSIDHAQLLTQVLESRKLLFCIPMNKEILGLWDRVEQRLYNIRHCLNIDGVRQTLSLFAPVIDPRALVAARASGLSIADAVGSLDSDIPNYRFTFMLEKARALAGTVQGLGSALLSALEKKDTEELTLIRSVHEQNIMSLTKQMKKIQIDESKSQLANLLATKKNVENRIEYYSGLIDEGLTSWETVQQSSIHTVSLLNIAESRLSASSAISALFPDVGAPTSMKYGGTQLERALDRSASALSAISRGISAVGTSAGVVAGNQRRTQEWENQLKLAEQELKAIEHQVSGAELRVSLAENDLQIHETQMEQTKELYEFYKNKFSNQGLYRYMATSLNRLFSQAYNLAFDLSKQTEKCYQFETDDQNYFIDSSNWDSGHAGLLAGENLTMQLNRLESSYLEKNKRREEITQSFSIRMLDPSSLYELKTNGESSFVIPEWAFDLFYPGHYRRRIKSIRVSIPCVVGPYTNVSCRLSLTENKIRTKAIEGEEYLFAGPSFANGSISTSTANNDGGQFELNFNDARYLPFEGGGAVDSKWTIQLPTAIKPFEYSSISDVIVHISYDALYDSTYRTKVESTLVENINLLQGVSLQRGFSLKQDFPDQWYEFTQLADGESIEIEISDKYFPLFAQGRVTYAEIGIFNLNQELCSLIPVGNNQVNPIVSRYIEVVAIKENPKEIEFVIKYKII